MTFTAIDFETGCGRPESACAVAACTVENGRVVDTYTRLIRPPDPDFDFEMINIAIHGITPGMVRDEPGFDAVWDELHPRLENTLVVAHWAPFDIGVLRALLRHYGLDSTAFRYACTCRMARRAFPGLSNHKLNTVSDHLGIELIHHDAASDALAAARIAIECAAALGKNCPGEIVGTKPFTPV